MSKELYALIGGIIALLSYWAGWNAKGSHRPSQGSYGGRFSPDWRRSFSHENINRPAGEPPLKLRRSDQGRSFNHENTAPNSSEERPLKFRRSGDGYSSGPTTPKPDIISKPQFPPPQIIREDFLP